MSQTLKVRLPIADMLIVDSIDHMLAQDVVRLIDIGLIGKQIRRDEICFVNRGTLVTAADSRDHLVSQPRQIRFQMAENLWCGEDARKRLVPV